MVYNTRSKSRNGEPPPGASNGVAGPSGTHDNNGCIAHQSEAHQAPPVNIDRSAPPTAEESNLTSVYFPYLSETQQTPHTHGGNSVSLGSRHSPPQQSLETPSKSVITRSIGSTRSSNTIKARKLAAEALHARQLCDIAAQQAELQRKSADLHLQAELAAIEAESSRGSVSRGSVRGNDHISDHADARADNINQWLDNVQPKINLKTTTESRVSPAGLNSACHQTCTTVYNGMPDIPPGLGPGHAPSAILSATHRQNCILDQHPVNISPNKIPNNFQTPDGATIKCEHNNLIRVFEALTSKPKKCDIKLPVFDGKSATDWLAFKRIFIETQASYTTMENLARISSSLRGAAREAVYILLVSANDPMEVIDTLEMRFGRPEKIVLQEINAVRALPKVGTEGKDLANFACRVKNCIGIIKLLDQFDYLHSPEIFNSLITKLSPIIRTKWYEFAASHTAERMTKLEMLSDYLAREVELQTRFGVLDFYSLTPSTTPSAEGGTHSDKSIQGLPEKKSSNSVVNKTVNKCIFCSKLHDINKCDKFLTLSVNERWQFIKKNKVCHRCLENRSHRFNLCKVNSPCGVGGCTYKHHSLLHNLDNDQNVLAHADLEDTLDSESEPPLSTDVEGEKQDPDNCDVEVSAHATAIRPSSSVSKPKTRPLLKVVAVHITGPQGTVETHALLDDGCTTTFIDSDIAKRVGIEGPNKRVRIDCVGGLSRDCDIQFVNFIIKGRDCTDSYQINSARSVKNLGINYRASVNREDICKYSYLADLGDVLCCEEVQPMLIIGVDNWKLTVADSVRAGKDHQPVAVHTALGWVLYGFVSSRTSKVDFLHHADMSEKPDDDFSIENAIKDYYKLDSIGIMKKDHRGNSDTHALKILDETVHRLPDGHFEAGLLWRSDIKDVPNNFKLALSRFLSLEKKMQSDTQYANMYRDNIKAMFDKKYAEECTAAPVGITWYLPHFGVTHAHKPGKLRVVHDAAAKFKGISLNSLLLPGPDLLQPLLAILMRFRENAVALTADIREMFPQVRIRPEDRDAQRFLWRNDPSDKLKLYRMSSMMFGACSSPCTALYVKNLNATEFKSEYPDAAHATIRDVYMDDYIGSLESVDQAARLARDIVHLNRKAGFEMRDWVSNNPSALSLLPPESISQKFNDITLGNNDNVTRVLGLNWQPNNDVIGFSFNTKCSSPPRLSKRDALSHLMQIYDPLGILGPLVSRGRVMFQSIWRKGLSWDDKLAPEEQKLWDEWFRDVQLTSQLCLPRYYGFRSSNVIHRELHLFCDASEVAYAAVAYWRYLYEDGTVKLALIGSKSRVTPLKPISIPRLELQAALIAARFASFIHDSHQHKPSRRIFWCDSLNVLGWLRSDARSFKPFVAHRIGEILETTDVKEWRWIPTAENVADDATRHKRTEFNQESRWITGPKFLLQSEEQWPSSPHINTACSLEMKPSIRNHCHHISLRHVLTPLTVDPKRLSSWGRLKSYGESPQIPAPTEKQK
uniref:Peptidase aspartic putative domain-containing protein n=1 Tax=Heliothis virescens TaxID=7102 RepID=A0A2A4IX21_HELVI